MTTEAHTESVEKAAPTGVILTDVAAVKVKALIEQEGRDDLRLRIAVQPGGCSGLRYQLFFDERSLDGDVVTDFNGVVVVVDRMSSPYLAGATIGLLSISKERSAEFLDTLEARLAARGLEVLRFAKPTHTKPAPESVLADIVERCDVVVEALAD